MKFPGVTRHLDVPLRITRGRRTYDARTELLWGHAVATYWDTQLGLRYESGMGPNRSWLAFDVQGIAPYWFEVDATAYVGEQGRTAVRVAAEYELLLTQKLIQAGAACRSGRAGIRSAAWDRGARAACAAVLRVVARGTTPATTASAMNGVPQTMRKEPSHDQPRSRCGVGIGR